MRIELFGYYFYPAFFITLIGVPLLIVLTIILIRRLSERRQVYSTSRITSWEKKYIPVILKKEKREAQNEHYEEILNGLIEYVEECMVYGYARREEDPLDLAIGAKIVYKTDVMKDNYGASTLEEINAAINADIDKIIDESVMPALKDGIFKNCEK